MKDDTGSAVPAENRRLAAIMFTDIVGFSRQMGTDEARTMRLLALHNRVIRQAVTAHKGTVIKTVGDAFLVDFPSVVNAVQCGQQVQAHLHAHNIEKERAEQIHVRIGIHLGDIIQQDGDMFGDGVNVASRLQGSAEPDTICISQKVYEEVEKKLSLSAVISLGRPKLKNIAQRFGVYLLLVESPKGVRQALQVRRLQLSRRLGIAHLSWPALTLAGLVLIAGTVFTVRYLSLSNPSSQHFTSYTQAGLPLPDKPSIIVLPFDNMSKDPEQEYFSDGITEDLTSDLSKISSLFVIARNSAFTYKGKAVKVQNVSREMGVQYALEGSVRKADNQVRITAQLIDATTGEHLWSERYDRELKDIFAVQDEVRQKIVFALKVKLTPEEQERFRRFPTDNLEAYDYVLRGVESSYRLTKEANTQARQMFERALALDPQYAGAYASLGWTYWLDWGFHWSQEPQNLERAFELAQRAVVLDDSLPDAHQLLGQVSLRKNQPEQALAEAERAIVLDPNYADSYAVLAEILSLVGRPQEAIGMAEKALRLDPRGPNAASYLYELGVGYFFAGRIEEAIATFKRSLMRDPNYQFAYTFLTSSYVLAWVWQLSQDPQVLERAFEAAQKALALNDSLPFAHTALGRVYLLQKQHAQARAEAERAIALNPNDADGYALLATLLNFIGKPEEALRMAEKAVRLNPGYLFELGHTYCLAGRYEEAIATLKQYLTHYPNFLHAQLFLAIASSEAGREEEARAAAAEVLRISPNFSLEVMKQRASNTDPAVVERAVTALRKAGLK